QIARNDKRRRLSHLVCDGGKKGAITYSDEHGNVVGTRVCDGGVSNSIPIKIGDSHPLRIRPGAGAQRALESARSAVGAVRGIDIGKTRGCGASTVIAARDDGKF